MKKVYLAGAIYEAQDPYTWRKEIKKVLPNGWHAVDPTEFEVKAATHSPDQLVTLDLSWIDNCDAMIVRALSPSWGTAMEIFYAKRSVKIPVIAIVKNANGPQPPWLTAHVYDYVNNTEEAAAALEVI